MGARGVRFFASARPARPSARKDLRRTILLQCRFIHFNPETGTGWNLQETVRRRLQAAGHNRRAHFAVLWIVRQRHMLDEEVWHAGRQLDGRRSAERSAVVVRSDRDVIGLRKDGDTARAANSPVRNIRPYDIDESLA